MPRQKKKELQPIIKYYICFGYDIDVEKWFIDIELLDFPQSENIRWFETKKEFEKSLQNYLIYQ